MRQQIIAALLLAAALAPFGVQAFDLKAQAGPSATLDDAYLKDSGDTSDNASTYTFRGKVRVVDVLQVDGGFNGSGVLQTRASVNGTDYALRISSTNGKVMLGVLGTGITGVGTSLPVARLQIAYSEAFSGSLGPQLNSFKLHESLLHVGGGEDRGVGHPWFMSFGFNSGSQVYPPAVIGTVNTNDGGNTAEDMVFRVRQGTADVLPPERMRITGDGNVGISTNAPATTLDVSGSAQFGNGATKSSVTAAGYFRVPNKTRAEISAITPGAAGEIVRCTDCAVPNLCVSTGTAISAFLRVDLASTGCGSDSP